MLNALGVGFRRIAGRSDGREQFNDEPVALAHSLSHRYAGFGQEYPAIRARGCEPLAFQPRYRLAGRRVRDAKPACDIDCPGFAVDCNQIGDQFGVVFKHRGRARLARLLRRSLTAMPSRTDPAASAPPKTDAYA